MARVSIDNGNRYTTAIDISDEDLDRHWDALVALMDDEAREAAHAGLAEFADMFASDPSRREFLSAYLRRAGSDLVVG